MSLTWLVEGLPAPDVPVARNTDLLMAWRFGYRAGEVGQFRSDLASLHPYVELWKSCGKLRCGRLGATAFASDDEFMLCELLLHEDECGGLIRTSQDAYRRMYDCVASSNFPHLLRTWCYFSAINFGEGESERYKQFCVGRARALGGKDLGVDPAATVIGRVGSSSPWLHLIFLAGKRPGLAIDNARQRLPRQYSEKYGSEPPRFSRGMLINSIRGEALLISGTAAVVDDQSQHPNNLLAQFHEAVHNMEVVLATASQQLRKAQTAFGPETVIRAYVRDEAQLFEVQSLMERRFPTSRFAVIAGEVCRQELLVELEAVHHF